MAAVQENICMTCRDSLWRPASWGCALVTLAGVPLSFFSMLYVATLGQEDLNGPAIAFHFYLCFVLAVPLALVNSFLIAPCVAKMVRGRLSAVGSHLILAGVWAGLILSLDLFFRSLAVLQFPAELSWLLMLWNLTFFLGPAVIVGSWVYSLKYNSLRRRLTPSE